MNPRLVFPFSEEKSIKTLLPNEEGLNLKSKFTYKVFPKFD